jgi:hypothetical protein
LNSYLINLLAEVPLNLLAEKCSRAEEKPITVKANTVEIISEKFVGGKLGNLCGSHAVQVACLIYLQARSRSMLSLSYYSFIVVYASILSHDI